jgi:hypothetical protein
MTRNFRKSGAFLIPTFDRRFAIDAMRLVKMKLTLSSTARRKTFLAFSRSATNPQTPHLLGALRQIRAG